MDDMHFSFKIENPPAWLPIGRTAENDWRTIEIDCSYWFNMDATGNVVLMYRPSCGMAAYPLLIERDGKNIVWHPKSGELVEGVGQMQAFFYVGESKIGSSEMVSCEVDGSLLGGDTGTDPGAVAPPWAIDIIEQIAVLYGHYPKIIDGDLYIWDSTLNEWVEFEASGVGAVKSVNGKTGVVVLDASDVGALPDDTPIPAAVTEQTVSGWGFTKNTGTYSKPSGGIPASDLAAGVQSSLGKADSALQTAPVQSVNGKTGAVTVKESYYLTVTTENGATSVDKTPAEIDALSAEGYDVHLRYTHEVGGGVLLSIDYAFGGYYPSVQMAALTQQYDGVSYAAIVSQDKTVDFTTADLDERIRIIEGSVSTLQSDKADKTEIPSLSGYATETWVEGKGYQTAQQVQAAISNIPDELPTVAASDNGKFLRVVNGAWAAEPVSTWQGGSY